MAELERGKQRCYVVYAVAPDGVTARQANELLNEYVADRRRGFVVFHDHFTGKPHGGLAVFDVRDKAAFDLLEDHGPLGGWDVAVHALTFSMAATGFAAQMDLTAEEYGGKTLAARREEEGEDERFWWLRRESELELSVVDGDITELEVDAIANAANNALWMGSGVAGAIKRAGGEEIEREAVAKGPIEVGEAVATGAGRLPAQWVIHGAVMGQDLRTDAALVRRTTESCLRAADELSAESLALPAFGTGVGGFPVDECARIMVEAVRTHEPRSLRRVVFAVFGEEAARAFREAL